MLLKDKVILVTGGSTGIGAATVRRAVQEGAKVMVHGRDQAKTEELCAGLGKAAQPIIASLEDAKSYHTLVAETVRTFGALHGLVNNAGVYPRNDIDSLSEDIYNYIFTINTKAPLFLSQAAVQAFRQQKTPGAIVNIGSMNAYCGQTDLLCYSMSKGALMTMTRNLADMLGPERIRVNQLNVGWTPTENEIALKRAEGLPDNWQERIPKVYAPMGRLQSPAEVAAHIIFWLSDLSAPTSGAVYEVEQYPVIGRNRINDMKI